MGTLLCVCKSYISKLGFVNELRTMDVNILLQEAMKFFEELVNSMGQNVKFCVENVCEGDGYNAAVNWHIGTYVRLLHH